MREALRPITRWVANIWRAETLNSYTEQPYLAPSEQSKILKILEKSTGELRYLLHEKFSDDTVYVVRSRLKSLAAVLDSVWEQKTLYDEGTRQIDGDRRSMEAILFFLEIIGDRINIGFKQPREGILNPEPLHTPALPYSSDMCNCTKVTICECMDGIVVVCDHGCFPKPESMKEAISKAKDTRFVRTKDTNIKMLLFLADYPSGAEVLEAIQSKTPDCSYSYIQLLALGTANMIIGLESRGGNGLDANRENDLNSLSVELARMGGKI